MTEEVKERTLPFKCDILDKEPQEVKNIFGGASCTIPPDAVAVYASYAQSRLGDCQKRY